MKCFTALLAAVTAITELASASRLKLGKLPRFRHSGSILAESATKLEVVDASAEPADGLEFEQSALTEAANAPAGTAETLELEQSALTEVSGLPWVYPDFKTKFPPASKAVDDFKTANTALNKVRERTLPNSPSMAEHIKHYEGLSVAADACQKAAERARNALQAITPNLKQAADQLYQDEKQADAKMAAAQAKEGMFTRVKLLNPWSEAAMVAKSTKEEGKAAATAAEAAEDAVNYVKNWALLLDNVALETHSSVQVARIEKEKAEAAWGP